MDPGGTECGPSARGSVNSLERGQEDQFVAVVRPLLLRVVCGVMAITILAACKDDVPAFFAKHLARRFIHNDRRHPQATDAFMPRPQQVLYNPAGGFCSVEEPGTDPIDLTSEGLITVRWPPIFSSSAAYPRSEGCLRVHIRRDAN